VRGNSDTMMLIRLDPDKAATSIMSIPRDLKVNIYRGSGVQTAKINAAYNLGGPRLAVRTVRRELGIPINHVIDMDFGGFRHAVDRVGCIYTDVDRRYFNDNSGGGEPYAQINLQPGYQKLKGQDALDYVRYRHTDNDFIRAARQQDFLRQARSQSGIKKLFQVGKRKLRVNVESLQGAQREAAYGRVVAVAKNYGDYLKKTDREIPVLRLTPAE